MNLVQLKPSETKVLLDLLEFKLECLAGEKDIRMRLFAELIKQVQNQLWNDFVLSKISVLTLLDILEFHIETLKDYSIDDLEVINPHGTLENVRTYLLSLLEE